MATRKTEYYFSGLTTVLLLALLILITGTFVYFIYVLFIAGVTVAVLICLASLYFFLPTLFNVFNYAFCFAKGTPALILTEDELVDNINSQVYRWAEIKAVARNSDVESQSENTVIAILLKDPNKFIKACKNPYKRFALRLSEKYLKVAFSIQPNIINCKSEELVAMLTEYHQKADIDVQTKL